MNYEEDNRNQCKCEKKGKNTKHQENLQQELHRSFLSKFTGLVMALDWHLRAFLFSVVILVVQCTVTSSVSESEALIQLKKSFRNATALGSWMSGSVPCRKGSGWEGLLCLDDIVTGLRLENMGLSGNIDVDALVNIPGLKSVSFAHNSFSGTIPMLNRIDSLRAIFLAGNRFSGQIPSDFFSKMFSLKKVSLADNKFTGEIPSSLVQLSRLTELHIENNQFSGVVPSLEQKTLRSFNASFNKLNGEIPSSLARFGVSSFEGNPDLCGDGSGKSCASPTEAPTPIASGLNDNVNRPIKDGKHAKRAVAAFIIMGLMLLSIIVVVILKITRKRKSIEHLEKAGDSDADAEIQVSVAETGPAVMSGTRSETHDDGRNSAGGEVVMVNGEKGVIGMPDLMKAAAEMLGNGLLGSSYKAVLATGMVVVVKRMRSMNALEKDEFDTELKKLGRLQHANVLAPLAYLFRKEEKLVIYEYIPNGSLFDLLHGDHGPSKDQLDWSIRLKIVHGIARGLAYLHEELAFNDLPHGNLKSSNVLLHPNNEPQLSEFGFNPLTYTTASMVSQALFAYKSPEAAQYGLSPKCDVYCLGIIILEIITGKVPSQYHDGHSMEGTDVVQLAASAISEGKEVELIDPEIVSTSKSLYHVTKLLHIGFACTESNPERRSDMRETFRRIEELVIQVSSSPPDGNEDAPVISTVSGGQQGNVQHSRSRDGSNSTRESAENFKDITGKWEEDQLSYSISLDKHER